MRHGAQHTSKTEMRFCLFLSGYKVQRKQGTPTKSLIIILEKLDKTDN